LRNIAKAFRTATPVVSESPLSSLVSASQVTQLNSSDHDEEGEGGTSNSPLSNGIKSKVQSRRHYIQTLHKVIDESDIILLVLDARDPEGCRSRLVEEEVRKRESEGKKLVFVLNKIGD
jgi:nuclear GTP-binding protein